MPAEHDELRPPSTSPPRRVLVADDNLDAAESLQMWLQMSGHEVEIAQDGPATLAAAESFRPDVVLLDLGMPGMTGLEVARRIREAEWGRGMILMALTGWGQEEDRQRTAEAGFDHHLTKPIDPDRIDALIRGA
jgi:CheY-like chemotaxis protein